MDVVEQNMSSFIHSVYLQGPMEFNILNQFNYVFHLNGLFYVISMKVRWHTTHPLIHGSIYLFLYERRSYTFFLYFSYPSDKCGPHSSPHRSITGLMSCSP